MQWSTHSSQIRALGPAMSFRASFCVLPQNEHLNSFDCPVRKIEHMY
jgi:hypothetical protein